MPEYVKRLRGETTVPKGHRIVRLLATERELVGPGANFIYVFIVAIEADPDDDE